MTRKDYVLIAATIKAQTEELDAHLDTLYRTACKLAVALASDNPRFDMQRFIKACGFHSTQSA